MNRSGLALALLCAAGCSRVRIVPQPLSAADASSVTEELEGNAASIKLRDDTRSTIAADVVVTPRAVEWRDRSASGAAPRRQVPTAAVERIAFRKHALGAVEGMFFGLGIGVAVGLLNGATSGGEHGAISGIVALDVGATSALVFALIGGLVGHSHSIELATSPPP